MAESCRSKDGVFSVEVSVVVLAVLTLNPDPPVVVFGIGREFDRKAWIFGSVIGILQSQASLVEELNVEHSVWITDGEVGHVIILDDDLIFGSQPLAVFRHFDVDVLQIAGFVFEVEARMIPGTVFATESFVFFILGHKGGSGVIWNAGTSRNSFVSPVAIVLCDAR